MSIYSRARKHINMERVKELKEEKYIAELKKEQEIVLAEIFIVFRYLSIVLSKPNRVIIVKLQ